MSYARTYPSRGYTAPDYKGTLCLYSLTAEQRARTCQYWFTVTDGSTAHTAFRTLPALLRWLDLRGLKLSGDVPVTGVFSVQNIIGSYRNEMHMSYDDFYALHGERIRVMSNGDYTLGIVTVDPDGLRTVHTLNPNCHDRVTYPHSESRAIEDAGA